MMYMRCSVNGKGRASKGTFRPGWPYRTVKQPFSPLIVLLEKTNMIISVPVRE